MVPTYPSDCTNKGTVYTSPFAGGSFLLERPEDSRHSLDWLLTQLNGLPPCHSVFSIK